MPDWSIRLDRFLWFARIAKTRSLAQALAANGHVRIDGRPVSRPATPVRVGNILTFATPHGAVRTIRIEILPVRRGPPAEAQACYQDLTTGDGTGPRPTGNANVSQEGAID